MRCPGSLTTMVNEFGGERNTEDRNAFGRPLDTVPGLCARVLHTTGSAYYFAVSTFTLYSYKFSLHCANMRKKLVQIRYLYSRDEEDVLLLFMRNYG